METSVVEKAEMGLVTGDGYLDHELFERECLAGIANQQPLVMALNDLAQFIGIHHL